MGGDRSDDETSLAAIRAGDVDALERLYRTLRVPVFAVALAITSDRSAAEDVLQDTFVRVFARAATYRPGTQPRAWVLAIARNLAFDVVRRRRSVVAPPEAVDTGANTPLGGLVVTQALLTLDAPEREIVALRVVADLTHAEIAEVLGLPPGTVRWRYQLALDRLRGILGEGRDE